MRIVARMAADAGKPARIHLRHVARLRPLQQMQQLASSYPARGAVERSIREMKWYWHALLPLSVVVSVSGLMVGLHKATRPPEPQQCIHHRRPYPIPMITWAENMHACILGAQCVAASDALVCDVRTEMGVHKVKCAGERCWLMWTQEGRRE